MKLLYTLNGQQMDALGLAPGEEPMYCVPVDLEFDSRKMQAVDAYAQKIWIVVTQERFLVLDGVQDPGNVGTILRTADAFSAVAVLLPGCAVLYNPKTLRAGMGIHFRSVIYRCGLEELTALLKEAGLPLYGAALREDTADVREVDLRRCAMAVGSEGRGLSAEVLAACARTVRIPMELRCESLNAASAASVLLWEAARTEI